MRPRQFTKRPAGRFSKPSRFQRSRGGNVPGAQRIDPSRFINKVVISEEIEHFVPEHRFSDFAIEQKLKEVIAKNKYELPTPIQDKAIPHILMGVDMVGIANTGTGKTIAFLVPLINAVLHNKNKQILIVAPTRELAIQIDNELKKFTPPMKIFSVCCVGGAHIGRQISELRYHNNFIIGTPGRLRDLIDRKMIDLSKFSVLVLDEADRMLDMGFINDIRFLMAGMPTDRQTLLFSATISREIEVLINKFLKQPVRISVKTRDTSKNVDQDIVRIKDKAKKIEVLCDILRQEGSHKTLVFTKTKHGAEKLSRILVDHGFKAESIHGDKTHSNRQRALRMFKENQANVLVATDVAARGLDIADISHVINYDVPATYDDYVHRIGRTGRGNKQGKALTFIE